MNDLNKSFEETAKEILQGLVRYVDYDSVDQAVEALLVAIDQNLPKSRNEVLDPQTGSPIGMQGCIDHGYNQALKDTHQVFRGISSKGKE